jgi:hypothetical protein
MNFSKSSIKTKLKASGIHFSLSLIIFFILAYQIYYNWYPIPYFSVDGGWQGIRLIAGVDLVLGPLITFLIFDLTKSRRAIIFDLSIIVVVQITALVYGIVTTYQQRPVAIILIDQFVVSTVESSFGSQLKSLEELNQFSPETPPIIFADMPLSRDALDEVMRIKAENRIPEVAQIQLYQPPSMFLTGLQNQQNLFLGLLEKSDLTVEFESWLQANQKQWADILVAPFSGRYGRVWLLFDRNAKYLDYIE